MSVYLANLPVLLLDCQTSGATPAAGQVVDVAWAAGLGTTLAPVESTCVALPEGVSLPRRIARLTGLTDLDLAGAPSAEAVAAQLRAARGERVVVAHFAAFERRFLDGWLGAETPWICTHALARRLLPDLPRRGLRAVAGHLGLSLPEHKRAAGHVQATALVWAALLDLLTARAVHDQSALADLLAGKPPPVKPARERVYALPRAERLALPSQPGVYRMYSADGRVLYVGKATDLRQRVNSYFRGRRGQGERKLELVTQVHRLEVTPTASSLEAALLEVAEIQVHQPPYNVALRARDRALVFVDDHLAAADAPDARHRHGPLSGRALVESLRRLWAGEAATWPWPEGPDAETWAAGCAAWLARPAGVPALQLRAAARRVETLRANTAPGADTEADLELDIGAPTEPGALAEPEPRSRVEPEPRSRVEPEPGSLVEPEPRSRAEPEPWTVERVAAALEDWALGLGDSLRRARLLGLLLHSEVDYLADGALRRLRFSAGHRVEVCAAAPPDRSSNAPDTEDAPDRPTDVATWDRAAVLLGGLRALVKRGTPVTLHLPGQPPIEGAALATLLSVV